MGYPRRGKRNVVMVRTMGFVSSGWSVSQTTGGVLLNDLSRTENVMAINLMQTTSIPGRSMSARLRISTGAKRALMSLAATMALFTLVSILNPTSAAAAPYPTAEVQVGANIRSCASTACGSYGTVGRDTWGKSTQTSWVSCYADGGWATGNYRTNRWFRVYVTRTGSSYAFWGYVHASYVYNQPRVVRC